MHRQSIIAGKSWSFPEIEISAGAYFFAAAWILLLPFPWVAASVTAAAVHEMGHLAALWLCDIKVWKLQIGVLGAKIDTEPLKEVDEMICALAGPLTGLLLCLFWRWIPRVAIWAMVQSVFNLLPIYPMDGGRALQAMVKLCRKHESLEKSVAKGSSSGYNNPN